MNFRRLFLTFFYTGLSPKAPGTVGSLAGLIVGLIILAFLPVSSLTTFTIALTVIAVLEINKHEAQTGLHDQSEIVIDEVAGIWLTLAIAHETWLHIILGFLFFRLYDIWKPSVIGRVDRDVKGGLGVMGDDILAGFFAGLSTLLVIHGYEKFLG